MDAVPSSLFGGPDDSSSSFLFDSSQQTFTSALPKVNESLCATYSSDQTPTAVPSSHELPASIPTTEGSYEYGQDGSTESPWVLDYTVEGHAYWYNYDTGESCWCQPEEVVSDATNGNEAYMHFATEEGQPQAELFGETNTSATSELTQSEIFGGESAESTWWGTAASESSHGMPGRATSLEDCVAASDRSAAEAAHGVRAVATSREQGSGCSSSAHTGPPPASELFGGPPAAAELFHAQGTSGNGARCNPEDPFWIQKGAPAASELFGGGNSFIEAPAAFQITSQPVSPQANVGAHTEPAAAHTERAASAWPSSTATASELFDGAPEASELFRDSSLAAGGARPVSRQANVTAIYEPAARAQTRATDVGATNVGTNVPATASELFRGAPAVSELFGDSSLPAASALFSAQPSRPTVLNSDAIPSKPSGRGPGLALVPAPSAHGGSLGAAADAGSPLECSSSLRAATVATTSDQAACSATTPAAAELWSSEWEAEELPEPDDGVGLTRVEESQGAMLEESPLLVGDPFTSMAVSVERGAKEHDQADAAGFASVEAQVSQLAVATSADDDEHRNGCESSALAAGPASHSESFEFPPSAAELFHVSATQDPQTSGHEGSRKRCQSGAAGAPAASELFGGNRSPDGACDARFQTQSAAQPVSLRNSEPAASGWPSSTDFASACGSDSASELFGGVPAASELFADSSLPAASALFSAQPAQPAALNSDATVFPPSARAHGLAMVPAADMHAKGSGLTAGASLACAPASRPGAAVTITNDQPACVAATHAAPDPSFFEREAEDRDISAPNGGVAPASDKKPEDTMLGGTQGTARDDFSAMATSVEDGAEEHEQPAATSSTSMQEDELALSTCSARDAAIPAPDAHGLSSLASKHVGKTDGTLPMAEYRSREPIDKADNISVRRTQVEYEFCEERTLDARQPAEAFDRPVSTEMPNAVTGGADAASCVSDSFTYSDQLNDGEQEQLCPVTAEAHFLANGEVAASGASDMGSNGACELSTNGLDENPASASVGVEAALNRVNLPLAELGEADSGVLVTGNESSKDLVADELGWAQGVTPEGFPYWYNYITGESSWELPEELQAAIGESRGDEQLAELELELEFGAESASDVQPEATGGDPSDHSFAHEAETPSRTSATCDPEPSTLERPAAGDKSQDEFLAGFDDLFGTRNAPASTESTDQVDGRSFRSLQNSADHQRHATDGEGEALPPFTAEPAAIDGDGSASFGSSAQERDVLDFSYGECSVSDSASARSVSGADHSTADSLVPRDVVDDKASILTAEEQMDQSCTRTAEYDDGHVLRHGVDDAAADAPSARELPHEVSPTQNGEVVPEVSAVHHADRQDNGYFDLVEEVHNTEEWNPDGQLTDQHSEDVHGDDQYGESAACTEDNPWVESYTEDGYVYWYNFLTGESSWEPPGSIQTDEPAEVNAQPTGDHRTFAESSISPLEAATPQVEYSPRPSVCWGFGGTLAVLFSPSTAGAFGSVYLCNVEHLLSESEVALSVTSFPGPVDSTTPKEDILQFTQAQREIACEDEDFALLWGLLHILCKSDGLLDGSAANEDASELLDLLIDQETGGKPASPGGAALVSSPLRKSSTSDDEHALAAELERLLIRGQREAACQYAMTHDMWADALLLSSHMDANTWRMVMARFAAQRYTPGAPLRTLYSLFADAGATTFDGWRPDSSSLADAVKWRRNVAMMLANPLMGDTDIITSLGDQLATSGSIIAAHCCYLLAEVSLQAPAEIHPARLVLLGYDPTYMHAPSCASVQASEIYCHFRRVALASQPDYVRNLDFTATTLLPHQLYYAFQLCDLGRLEQAAAYVDIVQRGLGALDSPSAVTCGALAQDLNARLTGRGWPPNQIYPAYGPDRPDRADIVATRAHDCFPDDLLKNLPPAREETVEMQSASAVVATAHDTPCRVPEPRIPEPRVPEPPQLTTSCTSTPAPELKTAFTPVPEHSSCSAFAPANASYAPPVPPPSVRVPSSDKPPPSTTAGPASISAPPQVSMPSPLSGVQLFASNTTRPESVLEPLASGMQPPENDMMPASSDMPLRQSDTPPCSPQQSAGIASTPVPSYEPMTPLPAAAPATTAINSSLDQAPASGLGTSSGRASRRGFLGGLTSVVGSALSFLPGSRSTQLDDFSEFVYNEKYGAWMPGDVDPDEWANENLAAPPPPPKAGCSSSTTKGAPEDAAVSSTNTGHGSAPQTPLGNQPRSMPGTGTGNFSARSTASRRNPRSRYVDTFNQADPTTDRDLMPPPSARPKPATPAYNIFTPQKSAD